MASQLTNGHCCSYHYEVSSIANLDDYTAKLRSFLVMEKKFHQGRIRPKNTQQYFNFFFTIVRIFWKYFLDIDSLHPNTCKCIFLHVFTVWVRSTTGGYVFTGVCLLTPGGGIKTHLHPIIHSTPVPGRRYLSPGWRVPMSWGTPPPSHSQDKTGVTLKQRLTYSKVRTLGWLQRLSLV